MTVNVNNQSKSIIENSTIKKLLQQLDVIPNGIAVAVNNQVVVKEEWNKIVIQNDDHITIIQATQGG